MGYGKPKGKYHRGPKMNKRVRGGNVRTRSTKDDVRETTVVADINVIGRGIGAVTKGRPNGCTIVKGIVFGTPTPTQERPTHTENRSTERGLGFGGFMVGGFGGFGGPSARPTADKPSVAETPIRGAETAKTNTYHVPLRNNESLVGYVVKNADGDMVIRFF